MTNNYGQVTWLSDDKRRAACYTGFVFACYEGFSYVDDAGEVQWVGDHVGFSNFDGAKEFVETGSRSNLNLLYDKEGKLRMAK